MPTITIISTKGGAGKTTVATNLAVAALKDFDNVGLIDDDPQGSATTWTQMREAEQPELRKRPKPDTLNIVDCPPSRERRLVRFPSDLILIPCTPSAFDLVAINAVVTHVANHDNVAFVLNRCLPRVRETEEAEALLKKHKRPVLGPLYNRIIYSRAALHGQNVQEFDKNSAAAAEITKLWQKTKRLLK